MLRTIRAPTQLASWRKSCRTSRTWNSFHTAPCSAAQRIPRKWGEGNRGASARILSRPQYTTTSIESARSVEDSHHGQIESPEPGRKLPLSCPGCGALSQTVDSEAAGYYDSTRARKAEFRARTRTEEDAVFQKAIDVGVLATDMPDLPDASEIASDLAAAGDRAPICDRCHYLRYQSRGTGIIHPSVQSIQQIIEESPHKHNHIYHVIDAADFPMSLIPNLQTALKLPRLRTQNRRSRTVTYIRGRVAEVSFIITRSDLLAPKKEQVDGLVPYLREVLRDALGKSGHNVRLGNVRCVSAQRGWWTRTVKEDIWNRGGAQWMVGKVNVGKSALYEVVFPKGRKHVDTDIERIRNDEKRTLQRDFSRLAGTAIDNNPAPQSASQHRVSSYSPLMVGDAEESGQAQTRASNTYQESDLVSETTEDVQDDEFFDESSNGSLLPPPQPETAYPHMPVVSALPGTTASPIRIPFGNGKGELIDLPGIHRSSFDSCVKAEHHKSLVMRSRVTPEQFTVKPGQSILLGGVVRITPKTDELIFLAYPFVPLKAHVTSNDKAAAIQTGFHETAEPYSGTVESIGTDDSKKTIKSAGTFQLKWNVTKRRTGSLTDKAAGKMKAANLPFIIYSADILIESVGWVELTCQVRSRQRSFITEAATDAFGDGTSARSVPTVPEVEVFTPGGKFVAVRPPMNAWVLGGPKKLPVHLRRPRPRQTIGMAKRRAGGAAGQQRKALMDEK